MNYTKLADKYVEKSIQWLTSEYGDYHGWGSAQRVEENLNQEALTTLCLQIEEDNRVNVALPYNVEDNIILLSFN